MRSISLPKLSAQIRLITLSSALNLFFRPKRAAKTAPKETAEDVVKKYSQIQYAQAAGCDSLEDL